jgi:hypothetical protein
MNISTNASMFYAAQRAMSHALSMGYRPYWIMATDRITISAKDDNDCKVHINFAEFGDFIGVTRP